MRLLKSFFVLSLSIAAVLCLVNPAASTVKLSVMPGSEFFTDGIGYNAGFALRMNPSMLINSLPEGLYIGGDFFYSSLNTLKYSMMDIGGGLELGYSIPVESGGVSIYPSVVIGYGRMTLDDSYAVTGLNGFLIIPSLALESEINSSIALGAGCGCNIFIYGETRIGFTGNISLTFLFGNERFTSIKRGIK